jgi:hypothetical protein
LVRGAELGKMLGRFLQLFLLASLVLLLPSMFYLSRQHQDYSIARDYSLMQTHSFKENVEAGGQIQAKQSSQGVGPPPALDAKIAQAWKWANPLHGWGDTSASKDSVDQRTPEAGAIMSKMTNETAKAELGRATWRFLHTMTLRFPEKPTQSDRDTLLRFMHDFSRLYPCGECAEHFQALLKELPPQTSSRMASALWLCSAHNKVNERLGKPIFPCDKLDETYDCGCGDSKIQPSGDVSTTNTT